MGLLEVRMISNTLESDGATNFFSVPSNMDKTIDVLVFLTRELACVNNIVGIQILNEPPFDNGLTAFCMFNTSAYHSLI